MDTSEVRESKGEGDESQTRDWAMTQTRCWQDTS